MTTLTAATEPRAQRSGLGRDWRYLWSASAASTLGDGALLAALPLLAKSLTSDPKLISGVAMSSTLPWLLLALLGGAIVDRCDRRRLMIGAQIVQVLLVVVSAVIVTCHLTQIWMLYPLAFGVGTADILFTGASQALVPIVVPPADLEGANGRQITTEWVSREFAGPPLGAALFAFATPLPFWLDAATFLVSLGLIVRIRSTNRPASPEARRALFAEIGEGLRWLDRNRLPRTLTLIAGAHNFCEAMVLSTLVLFAHDVLHVGDSGFGLLLAAMAIGGVLGGLTSKRIVDRYGARRVALVVQVAIPLSWLSIGVIGRQPITVVALFTLFSLSATVWNVISVSLRQRLVPNELLGRVSGAGRMIAFGALPLGALSGGLVASSFGLVAPWIFGATVRLVASALAVPSLRRWDIPRGPAGSDQSGVPAVECSDDIASALLGRACPSGASGE